MKSQKDLGMVTDYGAAAPDMEKIDYAFRSGLSMCARSQARTNALEPFSNRRRGNERFRQALENVRDDRYRIGYIEIELRGTRSRSTSNKFTSERATFNTTKVAFSI
jgi:hypothetical protein